MIKERILALFDIHYPYNIKLDGVFSFLAKFKPTRIVLGGDILDLAYLSHWNELSPGKFEGKRLVTDYNWLTSFIKKLKTFGNPKIDYLIGNHEMWITNLLNKFPYLKSVGGDGLCDIENASGIKELGVNIIKFNKALKVGKLNFIHGIYTNELHAKKTLMAYQSNVRYGHAHDFQAHSMVSALDSSPRNAISCGCMCHRNAEYAHGRPNRWVNGFLVAYIQQNGTFTDYFIPVVNNQFAWNGEIFK